jgi:hypothetical protein
MYISRKYGRIQEWLPYELVNAEDMYGKFCKFKKNGELVQPDYQFILPEMTDGNNKIRPTKIVDMNSWLTFFGIWMAEGWCVNNTNSVKKSYTITISVNKQRVKDALYPALTTLGYEYSVSNDSLRISNIQLISYLNNFSLGASNKFLPEWCFKLSKIQSQLLINSMQLGDGYFCKNTSASWYSTTSIKLADQFQQLCLHAGYTANIFKHIEAGTTNIIRGKTVTNNYDVWRISVIKTKTCPGVNHGHISTQDVQQENVYDYKGPVFCLEVNSGVFMVRQNGKPCWTGNSRARGPITMLTHQP